MSKTIAYMGNKRKLVPTLRALMCQEWPDLGACHLVDAFFGAGGFALGVHDAFKSITLNDHELYSVLIATAAFSIAPPAPSVVLVDCNMEDGYITKQYCQDRKFFTAENGRIIDSFRDATRLLLTDPTQQAIAMGNLISAADAVANTTGVYGAYLKHYKRSSLKPLTCMPHIGIWTSEADTKPVTITHGDATTACLAAPLGALLYLDPPYTKRAYGNNYFVLNVIGNLHNDATLAGVTGIPAAGWQKSVWNNKTTALEELRKIVAGTRATKIMMSYSTDGMLPEQSIVDAFETQGWTCRVERIAQRRYTSQSPKQLAIKNGEDLFELVFLASIN